MLNYICESFKNLDLKIKKILKNGLIFSNIFCLFSVLILYIYHKFTYPTFFIIGSLLFKTSLIFFTDFIICGLVFDKIIKREP